MLSIIAHFYDLLVYFNTEKRLSMKRIKTFLKIYTRTQVVTIIDFSKPGKINKKPFWKVHVYRFSIRFYLSVIRLNSFGYVCKFV